MEDVPDYWERAPDLAPTGDSLAFRSEQFPALVVIIKPDGSHVHVRYAWMAGQVRTIQTEMHESWSDATKDAERIMGIIAVTILGADGGNDAMHEYFGIK